MQIEETPPMHTLFVASVSVHYNKQILSARFGNHIVETDKMIYKVGRKKSKKFLTSSIAVSAKKNHLITLFQNTTFHPNYKIFMIFITYLYIYNIFILTSVDCTQHPCLPTS